MIVAQPNSGVIPVVIYERKCPGVYTAKISVIIVSLLHDFMQLHPGTIELYDIGSDDDASYSMLCHPHI